MNILKRIRTLFTKKEEPAESPESFDEEKMRRILEVLQRNSEKASLVIVPRKNEKGALTGSKFGGIPYWGKERAYPVCPDGRKMLLLAQINFEETAAAVQKDPAYALLPKQGLLQFFVKDDDVSGCSFQDPLHEKEKNYAVIYHETIRPDVTEADVLSLQIPTTHTLEEGTYAPFTGEYALGFEKGREYISPFVSGFDACFFEALQEVTGQTAEGKKAWDLISEREYDFIAEQLHTFGHKMLGYPGFTQEDPRFEDAGKFPGRSVKDYDVLLLQMDSKDGIMWGDSGVCNFFISSEDLKKKDFSRVWYNWDCY